MSLPFTRGIPALLIVSGLFLLPQISHQAAAQDATGDQSATSKHTGQGTVIRDPGSGRPLPDWSKVAKQPKRDPGSGRPLPDWSKVAKQPKRDPGSGRPLPDWSKVAKQPPRDPGSGRILHPGPDHGQPDTGTVMRVNTPAANTSADKAKSPFNSRSDMNSSQLLRQQQTQDQRAKQMDMLSNTTKRQSDMQSGILRTTK